MTMRFYDRQHRFYAGIDLHSRSMHLCILDHQGTVVYDKNLPTSPDAFLRAIAPFRDDLVVGCECMFGWYWLADCCAAGVVPPSRSDAAVAGACVGRQPFEEFSHAA